MWRRFNPNPCGRNVGDCSVRALSKALDIPWMSAYALAADEGARLCDMPSSDAVWGSVLRERGFERHAVPDSCPDCYTAEAFLRDHPRGMFVLAFGGHVATAEDGVLYDSWDSTQEIPQYYWRRD